MALLSKKKDNTVRNYRPRQQSVIAALARSENGRKNIGDFSAVHSQA
jgi:hypothetical protein